MPKVAWLLAFHTALKMSNFLQKLTAKLKLFVETQWHDVTESKRFDFNFLPEAIALVYLNM